MTTRLDLGDGRYIDSDTPPAAIQAALLRMSSALEAGRDPKRGDLRAVMVWLERQDEKHGGIRQA